MFPRRGPRVVMRHGQGGGGEVVVRHLTSGKKTGGSDEEAKSC